VKKKDFDKIGRLLVSCHTLPNCSTFFRIFLFSQIVTLFTTKDASILDFIKYTEKYTEKYRTNGVTIIGKAVK